MLEKVIPGRNLSRVSVTSQEYFDPMKQFRAARKIYNLISENGDLVNKCHGFTILVLLLGIVLTLTGSGYRAFMIIMKNLSWRETPGVLYVLVMTITILIAIVVHCNNTTQLIKKLATTVNKIECENFDYLKTDIRQVLESFYSQLISQPVEFTANDFYTINLALLGSIITSVTFYEIILVQFYAS
ncbi:CLUMA_CG001978, isoform A [Clunio marinus]|uniref:CLUMA_CG001978, isoform A n=1 Tax=Clunio marinus TaxID=568069 RepID=A0A1J1HJJ6_9DIPT|nr:CLUMA_CG001978, isoform A [Clunio marinus]